MGCAQTLSVDVGESALQGPYVQVTWAIHFSVPGSDLTSLNSNRALLNLSLANATISSTTGTVTLSVADATTGQTINQQSFGYVVSGNSLYAQDPTAAYNWLQQFANYSNVSVRVEVSPVLQTITPGSASATGNAQYQGVTYGSGTASWSYTASGPRNLDGQ
jgi:hypothetical protein